MTTQQPNTVNHLPPSKRKSLLPLERLDTALAYRDEWNGGNAEFRDSFKMIDEQAALAVVNDLNVRMANESHFAGVAREEARGDALEGERWDGQ